MAVRFKKQATVGAVIITMNLKSVIGRKRQKLDETLYINEVAQGVKQAFYLSIRFT
jgi:hypothetical protein